MLEIFYEDREIIVVKKPAGTESQARHSFEPDMVSEVRSHIHNLSTQTGDIYVGVIHRLDKPVSGIMVYAKTKRAAATLSAQIQQNLMKKTYRAVVCGRCVDNVGNFVDYLLKDPKGNMSKIVEKGTNGAKRAELKYRVIGELPAEREPAPYAGMGPLSLVEIELLTGRHHQIRVQFASRGLPLWGDSRYGLAALPRTVTPESASARPAVGAEPPRTVTPESASARPAVGAEQPRIVKPVSAPPRQLALCACGLSFIHPVTGKPLSFAMEPEGEAFRWFENAVSGHPDT